jgi:transcriptional regulator with XRE-family HTH domain
MKKIRRQRIAEEIAAVLVAKRAKIDRSSYSLFEHGHKIPTEEQLRRIEKALKELVYAKRVIRGTAAAVGWPGPAVA